MKHLIVGLGNIGAEYANTRHNIGFKILDAFAEASNIFFSEDRYGSVAECRVKNQQLILLKPSTYMNLSGHAVRYWMQKEKIDVQHLLVLVDDLSLPFGTLRLRARGSAGGLNLMHDYDSGLEVTFQEVHKWIMFLGNGRQKKQNYWRNAWIYLLISSKVSVCRELSEP